MTDMPPPVPSSDSSPPHKRNFGKGWLWAAGGSVGVVALTLIASLGSLFQDTPTAPIPSPAAPREDTAATAAAPADLQTHQKLVAEVVQDLGREVLIGDSPTLGNPDASVVLLEFSDFQCPYCARAKEQISTFTVAHQEEVLLVFKHLPLTNIHPEALPAAQAAWAAGQQGKFWEFHDALFAQQESLGEDLYLKTAQTLSLNLEQFNRDRTSEMAQAAIAKDLALASELQLTGTPTFIMNELLIPGAVPAEFLSEALTRLQSAQSPATSSPTEVQ